MENIQTEDTEEIICPYCWNENKDIWEYLIWENSFEWIHNCNYCWEDFDYYIEFTPSYTTKKLK